MNTEKHWSKFWALWRLFPLFHAMMDAKLIEWAITARAAVGKGNTVKKNWHWEAVWRRGTVLGIEIRPKKADEDLIRAITSDSVCGRRQGERLPAAQSVPIRSIVKRSRSFSAWDRDDRFGARRVHLTAGDWHWSRARERLDCKNQNEKSRTALYFLHVLLSFLSTSVMNGHAVFSWGSFSTYRKNFWEF